MKEKILKKRIPSKKKDLSNKKFSRSSSSFTYIRCRSTRQKDVNWLHVVNFLQRVCNSEACEGTETETD